jgi:hypothetical protein
MKFWFYILVFAGFSVSLNSQTLNYYYGNLHSHTAYSDGNKDASTSGVSTPSASYAYAKLSQHFDFLGISEHNHYSGGSVGMKLQYYAQGLAQAAAANTGTFLCLYGMEWGVSSTGNGHVVIYGFNQLIGWETESWGANYDIYNGEYDYIGLFRKVTNNTTSFSYLAHPYSTDFSNLSNTPYNASYDSAIVGVPFRSGIYNSTTVNYTDYPNGDYFGYYRKMLSLGYHLGIGYDHDNHNTTFGRNNGGRLVILAPSLTQPNLITAMQKMHFYGSDDWNVQLDFKINTNIMGDSTSGLVRPTINFTHTDGDGEIADSIKIWAGIEGSGSYPTVIKTVKSINTLSYTDLTQIAGTNRYYFIEVVQQDGDRIISSPIWYRLSNFAGVEELKNNFEFLLAPNPVKGTLYISTSLTSSCDIEISDISGKIIHTEKFESGNGIISTEKFASGFYTVKISNGKFMQTKKLVIE